MRKKDISQDEYFKNVPTIPYDLLKELSAALIGVLVVVLGFSIFLSSPDVKPVTIQSWATSDANDFVKTATNELAGSTTSSAYGAPYNSGSGSVQSFGPISPQAWVGVHQPVDSASDFVLNPLKVHAAGSPRLTSALDTYNKADDKTRAAWLAAYSKALVDAKITNGSITIAMGEYGPVALMMANLLDIAQSGALDGLLLSHSGFYQTDYTLPLLFMGDGTYLANLAGDQKLQGSQWGMMNETGLYPGQTWLWLYTFWYQVPPFTNPGFPSDLAVIMVVTIMSLALMLIPFIPVLRDIPYWVPLHKLIWRTKKPSLPIAPLAIPVPEPL